MNSRALAAFINGDEVGQLVERNDVWSFRYARSWLDNPARFALSPHLPLQSDERVDGGSDRPVQSYFDNLLPEEAARALLANDAGIRNPDDGFALLEYYGAESAGSLALVRPGTVPATEEALRPLLDSELKARIDALPAIALTHRAPKKMSLAGAQHKLAVVLKDGMLFEPGGRTPSTHILKPDHPDKHAYPHSVINEWFVMMLAKRVGLDVPDVFRRYVPTPVYIVERFDRTFKAGSWQRVHAVDGCQLLNLSRVFKYSSWSLESLVNVIGFSRASAATRLRLFSWLVFCIVVCNGDSHLKNLSVLVGADGIRLSPHYDLLSDGVYETESYSNKRRWPDLAEFTAPVAGVKRYAEFTRAHLLAAGQALGLATRTATRLLDAIVGNIAQEADWLIKQVEAENAQMLHEHPELSATFAGELKCLRAIRHIVIAEMTTRLT
jgi:serine/threonine-protein kinase HipA